MKIALVGYGKMGRLLEERLLQKGHEVLAVIDPVMVAKAEAVDLPSGAAVYTSLADALKGAAGKSLKDVNAVIEFSHPDVVVENLMFLIKEQIPVVTGTTGWHVKLPDVEKAVNAASTSLLWSSNFSLGVNVFYRIAACAARLFDPFAEYDVAGLETHHNKKADAPSGTAKTLTEYVLSQMTRKKKAVFETLERKPEADEIHYASLRLGSVPGTHSLYFDSAADTIEITHTARSREGFAAGAVLAAQWLTGEKRTGIFNMEDVLKEYFDE